MSARGSTLVEGLVACALLATIAAGVASLLLMVRRLNVEAERSMVATTLAVARLQALRAVPFEYASDATPVDWPALAVSPADTLERDAGGWTDTLDEGGVEATSGSPSYVRRWAVRPAGAARPDTRAIEVCVFAWPAPQGAPPLVCVATVRARQS